jgi:hypothetical protein
LQYLEEFMSYVDVHSYGKKFNNKQLPADYGSITKREIISRYKFSIAFENAVSEDYVTEKFYDPLIAGSVPVYLGAPNVNEFAPGDHCYIDVNDFPSVKALATFLMELDNDSQRYQEYLKWKLLPFRDTFARHKTVVEIHALDRLCEILKQKLGSRSALTLTVE